MGMVMALLVNAFDTAWPPFFTSYINKRKEAKKIFPKVFLYYTLFSSVVVVFFFLVAKPIVYALVAEPFHDAHIVVGLIAASQALYGASSILAAGIYFAKKLILLSIFKWVAVEQRFLLHDLPPSWVFLDLL